MTALSTTVRIDGPSSGSGVIFDRDEQTYFVLSAKHVFKDAGTYQIVTPMGEQLTILYESISLHPTLDIAVFSFESENSYSATEEGNSDLLRTGVPVYVAGWAEPSAALQDRSYIFNEGIVNAILPESDEGYSLLYSNNTRRGMSGGPVFDELGRLIGIHGQSDTDGIEGQLGVLGISINTIIDSSMVSELVREGISDNLGGKDPDGFIAESLNLISDNDFEGAIEVLDIAIRQHPDSSRLYAERAWARFELLGESTYGTNLGQLVMSDINQSLQLNESNFAAHLLKFYFENIEDITDALGSSSSRLEAVRITSKLKALEFMGTGYPIRYTAIIPLFKFIINLDYPIDNALRSDGFDATYHQEIIENALKLNSLFTEIEAPGMVTTYPFSQYVELIDLFRNSIVFEPGEYAQRLSACNTVAPVIEPILNSMGMYADRTWESVYRNMFASKLEEVSDPALAEAARDCRTFLLPGVQ